MRSNMGSIQILYIMALGMHLGMHIQAERWPENMARLLLTLRAN